MFERRSGRCAFIPYLTLRLVAQPYRLALHLIRKTMQPFLID